MEIKNVSFQYGKNPVLDSVSAEIPKGEITTLLGPNGCGKSTLLQLLTKNLKPQGGEIYIEGRELSTISLKEFSRKAAIVHQNNTAPFDLTVKGLVDYGRTPYLSFLKRATEKDEEIVNWAMELTGVEVYRDRPLSALSGGQRQRAFLAMALAQKTEILFLDEPTTYLDIRYQIEILKLVQRLNKELGMTIVMVLHDINQAIYYSDRIIGMRDGKILMQGRTQDVISQDALFQLFHVNLEIMQKEQKKFVLAFREEEGRE